MIDRRVRGDREMGGEIEGKGREGRADKMGWKKGREGTRGEG